jgi:hypothetical protein
MLPIPSARAARGAVLAAAASAWLCALAAPASRAQEPTTQELRLPALGGAVLQVPAWKEVRKDQAVAVYEQLPEPAAQKPYYVLLCSLEEGPAKDAPVPWDKVRDNIVQAASKNGRKLTLEVKDPFVGAADFQGRRLVGEFQSDAPGKKVGLELVALVKDGKLLTVGLVAEALGPATAELVQGVAKSARLGP